MLVFLILCAFFQTLKGTPLLPYAGSSVATIDLMAREASVAPDDGSQQFRTVSSLLQSCLLTIFACVWSSAHPNINGLRDSGWTCFKRRVIITLCVVIAPESVLAWAWDQYSCAKAIAEEYNKAFAGAGETKMSLWEKVTDWFLSLWGKVVGWFIPLSKETTCRGDGQLWTTTHGFFIEMGGFILYDGRYPTEVLDYKRLAELLQEKAIDAPTVTERDLQDRSKGDAVSKAIIVLQTMWFMLQCLARLGQRLPLSELEVLTLAFAVVNIAIYAVWWDKPQSVGMAICVPLKTMMGKEVGGTTTPTGEAPHVSQTESPSLSQAGLEYSLMPDKRPLILPHDHECDESAGEPRSSWLRRMLRKDRKQYSFPFFLLFRLPYRIFGSGLRPFFKMGYAVAFEKQDLRVPMFCTSNIVQTDPTIPVFVTGTIFGAIHLLAWASEFPSPRELVLWRVSAMVLTVEPFLMVLGTAIDALGMDVIVAYITGLSGFLMPFYIASRFAVIIIALLSIRHPPQDVLRDVSWTSYIPHF